MGADSERGHLGEEIVVYDRIVMWTTSQQHPLHYTRHRSNTLHWVVIVAQYSTLSPYRTFAIHRARKLTRLHRMLPSLPSQCLSCVLDMYLHRKELTDQVSSSRLRATICVLFHIH